MPCGKRAALGVADVLRDHVASLNLSPEQGKAAAHILACRTGRLGGHAFVCDRCGERHFAHNSCRDRHCPRCGSLDQAIWAEAQQQHLLPLSYFHVVFTVPASLRLFFLGKGRVHALSDSRVVAYDGKTVTYAYRDRSDGNRVKSAELEGPRFCLRFLNHVLPPGFVRIRRYGFWSNRARKTHIATARQALGAEAPPPIVSESRAAACQRIFGKDPTRCTKCADGRLVIVARWSATRGPVDVVLANLLPRAP